MYLENKTKQKNSFSLIFFTCRGNSWKEKKNKYFFLKLIIKSDLAALSEKLCLQNFNIFFLPTNYKYYPSKQIEK